MKNIIIALVGVVILGGVWYSYNDKNNVNKNQAIKIGIIAPLSGDYAAIGEELKKGVDLAVDQLKLKGKDISVVYEDDQFDPKSTVSAANKLITIEKVDFAVVFSIEEAKPIISIFNEHKVPLVLLWDSSNFLRDSGPYIFSNGFSVEMNGQKMADFAYDNLKLRKVAVVYHIDEWSKIIYKSFEDQFKKNGGEIVFTDSVQVGTSDFNVMLLKIKSLKPDGIYFPLIPFDSISFIKQAKQLGIKTSMLSGDALIQDVIDGAGNSAENIYFTNVYSDNSDLSNLYKTKYGKESGGFPFVATGFDGIMKIGNQLNGEDDIKTTLDKIFGKDRTVVRVEKVFQVKDGKPVEYK
jgi:branched-chain amino acid transport system substrate-binding protein